MKNLNQPIITSLLDNDLYTFTVAYLYLQKFPRAIVTYKFHDRNNTVYPDNFANLLKEQIKAMEDISIKDNEISFMKRKCYYLPTWFYTFLKGYKFDSNEVNVEQDSEGHLSIEITGYAWRTVFWEVPILAIISELYHFMNGDNEKLVIFDQIRKVHDKCADLLENGLIFSDFGTRRRYSMQVQDVVVSTFQETDKLYAEKDGKGHFVGTSNVYLAEKYDLIPVGTMSHQVIMLCGALFGYQEANYLAMEYWQKVFNSDLGIFLYDTYGWEAFQKNFSKKHAMLFSGLRVDSGDNFEAVDKIIKKYEELGIDPKTKQVTFSNGLTTEDAIKIHKYVNGRVIDNYGIGTHFTCDIDGVKPMNIVIKLAKAQMTEKTEVRNCIKISDDLPKATGDAEEIELCKKTLKIG